MTTLRRRTEPTPAATIRDVARLARTSTATVSRVLNGRAGVAPNTLERVCRAIQALGFQPDTAAVQLSRRRWPAVEAD